MLKVSFVALKVQNNQVKPSFFKLQTPFKHSSSSFSSLVKNASKKQSLNFRSIPTLTFNQKRFLNNIVTKNEVLKKNQQKNQLLYLVKRRKLQTNANGSKNKFKWIIFIIIIIIAAYTLYLTYSRQHANFPEFDQLFSDPETTNKTSYMITAILAQEIFEIIINSPEKYPQILPYIDGEDGIDIQNAQYKFLLGKFGNYFSPFSTSKCIINSRYKISTHGSNGDWKGILKLRGVMQPDGDNSLIIAVKDFNISLEPENIEPSKNQDQTIKQFIFFSPKFVDGDFLNQTMVQSKQITHTNEDPGFAIQFTESK